MFTISIHAPHTESDDAAEEAQTMAINFNPRSPYGERRIYPIAIRRTILIFQSTLPIRRATWEHIKRLEGNRYFNPRSPYGERRHECRHQGVLVYHFNPRSPYGERRKNMYEIVYTNSISIHAPHTESDLLLIDIASFRVDFNPRSPYGERPCIQIQLVQH